jgi:hypothetical protein
VWYTGVRADTHEGSRLAGLAPANGAQLEQQYGQLARSFISLASQVARFQAFANATDFKAAPYSLAASDEAILKSATGVMSTALQNVDFTFLNEASGPF